MPDWNILFTDKNLIINEPNNNLVNFFIEHEKENSVKNIIDLGCGTGRHSLYFAEKNYPVHSVDSSENALDILKQNLKPSYKIKLSRLNLIDLSDIKEKYDLAVCINVLSHGKFNELEKMFYEIEKIIENNGYLFLIITPVEFFKYVTTSKTIEVEKNSYLYINAPDGEIIHHFYTNDELTYLLRNYKNLIIKNIFEYSPWLKKEVEHLMVIARK